MKLLVTFVSKKEFRKVMQALDDLIREVTETKQAVADLAGAVSTSATRVNDTINALKKQIADLTAQVANTVDPTVLADAAQSLESEQQKLAAAALALNAIAVPEPPAPPPAA